MLENEALPKNPANLVNLMKILVQEIEHCPKNPANLISLTKILVQNLMKVVVQKTGQGQPRPRGG